MTTKQVQCTNCGKTFTLGEKFQQEVRREDGMDACAECVGCDRHGVWPCTASHPSAAGRRLAAGLE